VYDSLGMSVCDSLRGEVTANCSLYPLSIMPCTQFETVHARQFSLHPGRGLMGIPPTDEAATPSVAGRVYDSP
jgi:hypothetical protein